MSQIHDSSERESTYRTPRWVKVFGISILFLVLVVIVVLVTGIGGEHGPNRHMSPDDARGNTPPSSVTEGLSGNDLSIHTSPIEHGTQQP